MSNVASDDAAKGEVAVEPWLCRVDSINYVTAADTGRVVLSGSHGGLYSAFKGLSVQPRGLVFNDGGRGLKDAGIASLEAGDRLGVAIATVAHWSARIGDAADMASRGIISHANRTAQEAGIAPAQSCAEAVQRMALLAQGRRPTDTLREYRAEISVAPGLQPVVCIDSASLIQSADEGRVVVTGSHGGLIGGDASKAINVAARFVAFNDAGGGCEAAGLGRLAPLDLRGIAAVTVAHESAEIGNGISTLEDGVVSHANATATALGIAVGMPIRQFLEHWLANSELLDLARPSL